MSQVCSFTHTRRSPPPTLFPYTTLFRSSALGYRIGAAHARDHAAHQQELPPALPAPRLPAQLIEVPPARLFGFLADRKSTRLNSSHLGISYAVFCLKKKKRSKLVVAYII